MIATLNGKVTEKLEQVIIEVGGVGYGLSMPRSDLESVSVGEEVKVYVYEVVREDSFDLYGFTQPDGKATFEQLLGVSGVGPKAALAILSLASVGQVQKAISTGDVAFLSAANGVGKRTAERIAVELKDKLAVSSSSPEAAEDTALQALVSLGYSRPAAAQALAKVSKDLDDEERIKQALKEAS